MIAPEDRKSFYIFGLGLILAGLLAGVLGTLWVAPWSASQEEVSSAVSVARPVVASPSEAPTASPALAPDMVALNQRFREVAQEARDAVVFIRVDAGRANLEWLRSLPGNRRRLPPGESIGSGVLLSPDGFIVTNEHVIAEGGDIYVTLNDRREFLATVVGTDRATDLAVLKIPAAPDLPVIRVGDSDQIEVGDWVLAVGNPFRLVSTVTAGIVSARGRQVNIIDDAFSVEDFIQTDAAINPGNSGGAVVNLGGELVGIATAIATESGAYEGYGFAVPSNLMVRVAESLIAEGQVRRGFLGVNLAEVSSRMAARLGMDRAQGVLLQSVPAGGAAHKAGLRTGDIILRIDGRPVNAANQVQAVILRYQPGDVVQVDVLREGQIRSFAVTLLSRDDPGNASFLRNVLPRTPTPALPPPGDSEVVAPLDWGIGFRDLTTAELQSLGLDGGALIATIERASPSDFAGIPRGGILLGIDQQPVGSATDAAFLLENLRSNPTLLLRILRRDGTTGFYELVR